MRDMLLSVARVAGCSLSLPSIVADVRVLELGFHTVTTVR